MTTFANGESSLSVRTKINNVLQHADGTAGELVINEAGADVDFRVESDTSTHALFVDGATGNVGIGTSSPSFNAGAGLHIYQTTGSTLRVQDSTTDFDILSLGSNAYLTNRSAGAIIAYTNGAERMRLDASGNLLIGTSSSGASKLRISGLPTSSAGLSAGDVWNDGGTLKIA